MTPQREAGQTLCFSSTCVVEPPGTPKPQHCEKPVTRDDLKHTSPLNELDAAGIQTRLHDRSGAAALASGQPRIILAGRNAAGVPVLLKLCFFARRDDSSPAWGRRWVFVVCPLGPGRPAKLHENGVLLERRLSPCFRFFGLSCFQ